ncbi:MAG TPA: T9SS type A sorting domain-containing protein, partial [Flavobacteriales bacterium]|nr:T9SS type A sorting domain-containing protein [Flavobacteriales bacterium]
NPTTDNTGPEIKLFMNNEQFVSGGLTDQNPDLLAYVQDDIGINTVGTGIGHDITAILDGDASNPFVLNDYYEAEQDNFRKGKIRYPFKNLAPGKHTITLKVWDVANNSSTASIEFIVVKSEELSLEHVLNYPNPFTTHTQFYYEYNQPGVPVQVDIQVFTVAGKMVKSINTSQISNGYRSEAITWDGLDDFGDKIGRGVYVYRLRVRTPDGKSAEKIEKLVIL